MKSLSSPRIADAPLLLGWGGAPQPGYPLLHQSLFGLHRPIGQSLIRAHWHIIEFDSGLLIRLSDLRGYPGTMTPRG